MMTSRTLDPARLATVLRAQAQALDVLAANATDEAARHLERLADSGRRLAVELDGQVRVPPAASTWVIALRIEARDRVARLARVIHRATAELVDSTAPADAHSRWSRSASAR